MTPLTTAAVMDEQRLQEIEQRALDGETDTVWTLHLIAEVRRLQQQQKAVQETWIDEVTQARQERDAALAERDALLVQVDQWRQMADREVTACVEMRAERDEARRVLREVDKRVIQCSMCYAMIGGYRPEPHTPDCAIAAVLAQEEK